MKSEEELNLISGQIIGRAIEVHKTLGAGLLESTYRDCLFYELVNAGLKVDREKPLTVRYKELTLDYAYKLNLLV